MNQFTARAIFRSSSRAELLADLGSAAAQPVAAEPAADRARQEWLEVDSGLWPCDHRTRCLKEDEVTLLIRLSELDNVAVAAKSIAKGTALAIDGHELAALDPIPFAHKIALRPIERDAQVVKYGVPIGRAKVTIQAGRHVHVHNIRSDYVNNEVDFFEEATAEGGSA